MTTLLAIRPGLSCDETLDQYRKIIHETHQEIITTHQQRYDNTHTHHPKYKYNISDRGVEVEVRVHIHFYNVLEYNNLTTCRLVDAHRAGDITLVENKDYKGVFNG